MNRNDPGHVETDKELAKLEKRIEKEYKQAYKELAAKFEKYNKDFDRKDKAKLALVKSGQLSREEYIEWRKNQILVGERWKEMRDTLATDLTNTQRIATSMTKEFLPDAYAINHNYGTFEVEKGSHINTSYTLYDRETVNRLIRDNPKLLPAPKVDIPKAQLWNKRKLTSAITQGVLQGEAIPDIAKRLMTVTDMSKAAAIRNARTMTTSAECAGRIDSYKRAEDMGIEMQQAWVATLDDRTRHEHRLLDGQIRPVGEPFEVEGQKILYPGDPAAEPYLVYNCRCTVIALVKGTSLENGIGDYPRILDPALGDMTYEEWKGIHEEGPNYKTFSSGEEANKWFGQRPDRALRRTNREEYDRLKEIYDNSMFRTWLDKLSAEQSISISNYSGDAYSGINGLLRHQMTKRMVDEWNATERISIQDMIKNIESAIDEFELREPIKVFRTCENDVLENLKLSKGSVFHDDGFGSTSILSEKVASGNIVMQINVPQGKGYGAWINPLSGAEDEEYEFLLQRGSDYEVKSIVHEGDDTIVELDLLGNTKNDWSYATKQEVIDLWKRRGDYDEDIAKRI